MEQAKIYSYSILRSSIDAFADRLPYCSAILEFEDGRHCAALLAGYVDGMDVKVGQSVKVIGKNEAGEDIYSL